MFKVRPLPLFQSADYIQQWTRLRLNYYTRESGGDNLRWFWSDLPRGTKISTHIAPFRDFVLTLHPARTQTLQALMSQLSLEGIASNRRDPFNTASNSIDWEDLLRFLVHILGQVDLLQPRSLVIDVPFYQHYIFPETMRLFFFRLKCIFPRLICSFTDTRMCLLLLEWEREMQVCNPVAGPIWLRQDFWFQIDPDTIDGSMWIREQRARISSIVNYTFTYRRTPSNVVLYMSLLPASRLTAIMHAAICLQGLTSDLDCLPYRRQHPGRRQFRDQILLRLDFQRLIAGQHWHSIAVILDLVRTHFSIDIVGELTPILPHHATEDQVEDGVLDQLDYYHWSRVSQKLDKVDIRVVRDQQPPTPAPLFPVESAHPQDLNWLPGRSYPRAQQFEWRFQRGKYVIGLPSRPAATADQPNPPEGGDVESGNSPPSTS